MPGTAAPEARHRADLRRSVRLFRAFRQEQSDPAMFYGALAEDSVGQLRTFTDLEGRTLLDVGGGPGFFREAFERAGVTYVSIDADLGELAAVADPGPRTVLGSGLELPVRSDAVDVCYSSNVLEHVPQPWAMAGELVRVTRPGGLVFLSYTVWGGPWGGHETSPWHWAGGARAARRYARRHGHPPKNLYGESLFAVSVSEGLAWARSCTAVDVLSAGPRYLPSSLRWVVEVPAVREVATWNLLLVLRVR